jgi:NAD(P)-dependent dehydrogenase (short-subunit alcohol dehydrogenase family)
MGAILESFRLDGKVAIVTGVGPTNGRHFALAMAEAGADVCLVARSTTYTESLAEELRAMGRRTLVVACDVTDSAQVDKMVARARDELGRVDILFNHAGGGDTSRGMRTVLDSDDQDWRSILTANLDSVFFCTRAAARVMVEQGWGGSIINTSSTASRTTTPKLTAYSTAKAGVNQFTRCMAVELAPHDIRVNAIMLGTYENQGPHLDMVRPGFHDWWLAETPMHRFGKACEAAAAGLYLASDASSFVTGVVLPVAGGIALF